MRHDVRETGLWGPSGKEPLAAGADGRKQDMLTTLRRTALNDLDTPEARKQTFNWERPVLERTLPRRGRGAESPFRQTEESRRNRKRLLGFI